MGLALVVYLRTVGNGGAAVRVISAGSTRTCDGRVVWGGDEGL